MPSSSRECRPFQMRILLMHAVFARCRSSGYPGRSSLAARLRTTASTCRRSATGSAARSEEGGSHYPQGDRLGQLRHLRLEEGDRKGRPYAVRQLGTVETVETYPYL